MEELAKVQLFGGMASVHLPRRMQSVCAFRPVPDHQEVFTDAGNDQSVIVEILVRSGRYLYAAILQYTASPFCCRGHNPRVTSAQALQDRVQEADAECIQILWSDWCAANEVVEACLDGATARTPESGTRHFPSRAAVNLESSSIVSAMRNPESICNVQDSILECAVQPRVCTTGT
jgi:hypothetical protein